MRSGRLRKDHSKRKGKILMAETTEVLTPGSTHLETARQAMSLINEAVKLIRDLEYPTPEQDHSIDASASVSDDFLIAVATVADTTPAMAAAASLTGEELREVVDFSTAYTPLGDALELATRAVRYTIKVERAGAGMKALRAYQIAKGLNRNLRNRVLGQRIATISKVQVPQLENMKRALAASKRPRKTGPEAAAAKAAKAAAKGVKP
jgi:hypothetical protein